MPGHPGTPVSIDAGTPNAARMHDYYLGGDDNFPADRDAAEKVLCAAPWLRATALENRAFLGRAVTYLAGEAGIRQFVDIGTGLPTRGNVHEIAHVLTPGARVAYVDNDAVVLGHSRALLANTPNTATVRADLRDPASIIAHPDLTGLIDWTQPVAVLFVAVLHFITDGEDPAGIIAQFRAAMAPGSHLVITHLHHPAGDDDLRQAMTVYRRADAPLIARTSDQIEGYFDGFHVLEPGVVPLQHWRPDAQASPGRQIWGLGGIGVAPTE